MNNKYKIELQSAEGITRVKVLNQISVETLNDSPEESIYYNDQALDFIEKLMSKKNLDTTKKNKLLNLKKNL
ncbi:MAG: hypothetical protein ACP5FK_10600 [bacterium]